MKIWDSIKTGKKVLDARKDYKEAKARGETSISKELAVGVVAPGATWLMVRGTMVPVVSSVLSGIVVTADGFLTNIDLQQKITERMVDGAALAIVGVGFIFGVIDLVRSSARAGLWSSSKTDKT